MHNISILIIIIGYNYESFKFFHCSRSLLISWHNCFDIFPECYLSNANQDISLSALSGSYFLCKKSSPYVKYLVIILGFGILVIYPENCPKLCVVFIKTKERRKFLTVASSQRNPYFWMILVQIFYFTIIITAWCQKRTIRKTLFEPTT